MNTSLVPSVEQYVRSTGYDDRGRRTSTVFGPADSAGPSGAWMAQSLRYNDNQQLAGIEVFNTDVSADWSTPAVRHTISYDDAGLVTSRTSQLAGLGSWRECFGYDARVRLTSVRTVPVEESCEPATLGGGSQPYEHTYSYSPGNRLLDRTEDGQSTQYSYPASGQPRPYAAVQVGGATFEWDANGNLTERTEDGATEAFTWDAEQRLESVSRPDGNANFVYDVGGQRLLRTDADGSTLYFAGHEVTASLDGSTVSAVRSYSYAGSLIATRTGDGMEYLVTDERGSVEAVAPAGQAPSYERAYEPYGSEHAADGQAAATDRGFLGQVEDGATGLSYLNARYYDTDAGVFLSPDPIYDTSNIKSLNPYTYGQGAPTAFSDASGLSASYTFGVEMQNWKLGYQNKQFMGHIEYLGGVMTQMQGIIVQQQNAITGLLAHVESLEAVIRQQSGIIDQLNARVAYLTQQVNYWRGQAMYWRGQAAKWYSRAMYWRDKAVYYRGVIGQLVDIAYRPQDRAAVLASIDAGYGVPGSLTVSHSSGGGLGGAPSLIVPGGGGSANPGTITLPNGQTTTAGELAESFGNGSFNSPAVPACPGGSSRSSNGNCYTNTNNDLGINMAVVVDGACAAVAAADLATGGAAAANPVGGTATGACAVWTVGRWLLGL